MSAAPAIQYSEYEMALQRIAIETRNDPLGFCTAAWPWCEGALERQQLRVWQRHRLQ